MTPADYKTCLRRLGLTQSRAAKFLDKSVRTCNGYANGSKIPKDISLLLCIMVEMKLSPADVNLIVDKYPLRLG